MLNLMIEDDFDRIFGYPGYPGMSTQSSNRAKLGKASP